MFLITVESPVTKETKEVADVGVMEVELEILKGR
jgi:hypothetical protein